MKTIQTLLVAGLLLFTTTAFSGSFQLMQPEDGDLMKMQDNQGYLILAKVKGIPRGEDLDSIITIISVASDQSVVSQGGVGCGWAFSLGVNYMTPTYETACSITAGQLTVVGRSFELDKGVDYKLYIEAKWGDEVYFDEVLVTAD